MVIPGNQQRDRHAEATGDTEKRQQETIKIALYHPHVTGRAAGPLETWRPEKTEKGIAASGDRNRDRDRTTKEGR